MGFTLAKIPRKGGMEKLLKGGRDPKEGGCSLRKGGMVLVWVFFLAGVWQI